MKLTLSLAGLPTFETSSFYCSLDDDILAPLSAFPETFIRARVGLRFLQQVGGSAEHLRVNVEEESAMQSGYLRASLMELVGMEDALRVDVRRNHPSIAPLSIWDTKNAMLIILRELRNVHIHQVHSPFNRRQHTVYYGPRDNPLEAVHTVLTVPMQDLDLLKTRQSLRNYDSSALSDALEWIDWAQNHWGISDVVLRGFNLYARLIAERVSY